MHATNGITPCGNQIHVFGKMESDDISGQHEALRTANSCQELRVGIIGLSQVGLSIATEFSRFYDVTGFDANSSRIERLRLGDDCTGKVSAENILQERLRFTCREMDLADVNFYIVTVPAPLGANRLPDFSLLLSLCGLIGPSLRLGDIVVFESMAFPGATEEVCGPALAAASGLTCGTDFKLAYSPERIDPRDELRRPHSNARIVSGQDEETIAIVANAYESVFPAGVYRASSIKVAEAVELLENTQRDLDIGLINEMSKMCYRIGIQAKDVFAAAGPDRSA